MDAPTLFGWLLFGNLLIVLVLNGIAGRREPSDPSW